MTDDNRLLARTADIAAAYLRSLPTPAGRPTGRPGGAPGRDGRSAARRSDRPARGRRGPGRGRRPGLVASAGPRYFGFVVGGSLPAALGGRLADERLGPERRAVRPLAGRRRRRGGRRRAGSSSSSDLPAGTSVGFVTGATMANFTALAAARHGVLARVGWDVERLGLQGAPPVTVVTHAGTHVTVYASLQMLGLGREGDRVRRIAADDQGRMRPDASARGRWPDRRPGHRLRPGRQREHRRVRSIRRDHPDRPRARRLGPCRWRVRDLGGGGPVAPGSDARPLRLPIRGRPTPTSGSTCRTTRGSSSSAIAAAHHAAMTLGAAYYVETGGGERDNYNWVPESSRRARGFAVLAALRSLGRSGLVDLIERDCAPRSPDGRTAGGGSARLDPQRRGPEPGPRPVRGDRRRPRRDAPATFGRAPSSTPSSATGRAGWAGRRGPVAPRCGSPSRAGRRPRTTSTGRPTPSSPASPRSIAGPDEQRPRSPERTNGVFGGLAAARPGRGAVRVRQVARLVDIPVWRYAVNRAVTANTPWTCTPFVSVLMASTGTDVDPDVSAIAPDHEVTDLGVRAAGQAARAEPEVDRPGRTQRGAVDRSAVAGLPVRVDDEPGAVEAGRTGGAVAPRITDLRTGRSGRSAGPPS